MKKNKFFAALLAAAVSGLLITCGLPVLGEKAAVSVTLPGSSSTTGRERTLKMPEDLIEDMRYELVFTGPGATQIIIVEPEEPKTITVFLEPGRWRIEASAFFPYEYESDPDISDIVSVKWVLAGKNTSYIDVQAGKVNRADITLIVAKEFIWSDNHDRMWAWYAQREQGEYIGVGVNENTVMGDERFFYDFVVDDTEFLYQWYYSSDGKDWIKISGEKSSDLQDHYSFYEAYEETRYYYCEITGVFKSNNPGGQEELSVRSYSTMYSPNSKGLQAWINDIPHDAKDEERHIYLPSGTMFMTETVTIDKNITLYPNWDGTQLRRYANYGDDIHHFDDMFVVRNGTLSLYVWEWLGAGLDLNGDSGNFYGEKSHGSLVRVENGGELVIEGNVNLYYNIAANGGAVYVEKGGLFTMNGGVIGTEGTISVNRAGNGGGVYVAGEFAMAGGKIINNRVEAGKGGGVYVAEDAIFRMTGGYIENNSSMTGGGVYIDKKGTFIMTDGEIINNTATSNSPTAFGGGVYVAGTFTMTDGFIADNYANNEGGGVYIGDAAAVFSIIYNAGDPGRLFAGNNTQGDFRNVYKGDGTFLVNGVPQDIGWE